MSDTARPRTEDVQDIDRVLQEYPGMRRLGVTPGVREYLSDIWGRREFMVTLPVNQLRSQNQNTVFGNLWHLLNPLFLALVYYLVFGVILGARGSIENYPAFLITGIFVFYFTQKSVISGTGTIVSNLKLIQTVSFPRAILPISTVIGELLAQFYAMLAMFLLVLITGVTPKATWLIVPFIFLLQAVFNLGAAFIAARATFHFRDVAQFLPYIMRVWLYLSGIFFAIDFVPEGWPRTVFRLNPLWSFIDLNRLAILDGTTDLGGWLLALTWSVAALLVGFFFFRARETEYGRG